MRWSEQDLNAARQRMAGYDRPRPVKRSKLRNVKVSWQGRTFDSKHELKRFQEFDQQRALGVIRSVIPQVSIPLPGTRRRIRVDFIVVENDGSIRFWDAKGDFETQMSKLKRQQIFDAYGITIELC